jgi:anthrone oxygenase-like protein
MDVASFIAVLLAGLLTGSELTSWGLVHPTLWKLDHRAQVRAEKLIYRRFASVDPFLMTATVVACFVAAGSLDGSSATLALAAGVCFAGMLAITLGGNMPINLRVFRWDEAHGDPAEWRRIRRRWDRLHSVRIVLDSAGFVLMTLAVVSG